MNSVAAHFERLVGRPFAKISEVYREACGDLAIRIEPHASTNVMTTLDLSHPFDLYHGVNLAQKSVFDLPQIPDEIILYREPIIAYAELNGNALADAVKLVLEISHHFNFSDADMALIEQTNRSGQGVAMKSMGEMSIEHLAKLAAAGSVILLLKASAVPAAEIDTGRELAERLCAKCHMNPGQGEKQGASGIPSFSAVANRTAQNHEKIVRWLRSTPAAMPDHRLTWHESDTLALFIMSLRKEK